MSRIFSLLVEMMMKITRLVINKTARYAFHASAIRIMLYSDFGNQEKVLDVNFFLFAFKYKVEDLPQ